MFNWKKYKNTQSILLDECMYGLSDIILNQELSHLAYRYAARNYNLSIF